MVEPRLVMVIDPLFTLRVRTDAVVILTVLPERLAVPFPESVAAETLPPVKLAV